MISLHWKFNGFQENNDFDVNLIGISKTKGWNFNKELNFVHETNKFFSLRRVKYDEINTGILNQPDSGILAVLTTNIQGVLHILVQFKEDFKNMEVVFLPIEIMMLDQGEFNKKIIRYVDGN